MLSPCLIMEAMAMLEQFVHFKYQDEKNPPPDIPTPHRLPF